MEGCYNQAAAATDSAHLGPWHMHAGPAAAYLTGIVLCTPW